MQIIGWAISLVAVAAVSTTTPVAPSAQREQSQDEKTCLAQTRGANPVGADAKIAGCTALIDSGRLSKRQLALALILRSEGYSAKHDEALQSRDLDDAVKADPTFSLAWSESCSFHMWVKHDSKRAMEECTKAIDLAPDSASGWTYRGDIYLNLRDYERAIADYDHAIQLNPKWMWPWDNRGEAYLRSKKIDRAIEDFDMVIKIAPDYAMGFIDRGMAYILKGQLDLALADFEAGLKVDSKCADCLYGRNIVKRARGDASGADADLKAARALDAKVGESFRKQRRRRTVVDRSERRSTGKEGAPGDLPDARPSRRSYQRRSPSPPSPWWSPSS